MTRLALILAVLGLVATQVTLALVSIVQVTVHTTNACPPAGNLTVLPYVPGDTCFQIQRAGDAYTSIYVDCKTGAGRGFATPDCSGTFQAGNMDVCAVSFDPSSPYSNTPSCVERDETFLAVLTRKTSCASSDFTSSLVSLTNQCTVIASTNRFYKANETDGTVNYQEWTNGICQGSPVESFRLDFDTCGEGVGTAYTFELYPESSPAPPTRQPSTLPDFTNPVTLVAYDTHENSSCNSPIVGSNPWQLDGRCSVLGGSSLITNCATLSQTYYMTPNCTGDALYSLPVNGICSSGGVGPTAEAYCTQYELSTLGYTSISLNCQDNTTLQSGLLLLDNSCALIPRAVQSYRATTVGSNISFTIYNDQKCTNVNFTRSTPFGACTEIFPNIAITVIKLEDYLNGPTESPVTSPPTSRRPSTNPTIAPTFATFSPVPPTVFVTPDQAAPTTPPTAIPVIVHADFSGDPHLFRSKYLSNGQTETLELIHCTGNGWRILARSSKWVIQVLQTQQVFGLSAPSSIIKVAVLDVSGTLVTLLDAYDEVTGWSNSVNGLFTTTALASQVQFGKTFILSSKLTGPDLVLYVNRWMWSTPDNFLRSAMAVSISSASVIDGLALNGCPDEQFFYSVGGAGRLLQNDSVTVPPSPACAGLEGAFRDACSYDVFVANDTNLAVAATKAAEIAVVARGEAQQAARNLGSGSRATNAHYALFGLGVLFNLFVIFAQ